MEEKRKFERFNIDAPARIELISQEGCLEEYHIRTNNLSAEGICFAFERALLTGSQIKIEIFLNFDELKTPSDPRGTLVIATTGHVVRTCPRGIALRFDKDYDLLARLDLLQKGE